MFGKSYQDSKGIIYFASAGLGGDVFMTMKKKNPSDVGKHRVTSSYLPVRSTLEEAQKDLDAYAKAHNWKVYSGSYVGR